VHRHQEGGFRSAYRGNPSSGIGSHGAAYAVNWRYDGLIPGSASNVPIRTNFSSGSARFCAHSPPPHAEQKTFEEPSGGSKEASSSSPLMIRTEPGAALAEIDAAPPVRRWQRVQWQ
jgi:hypothetical protein